MILNIYFWLFCWLISWGLFYLISYKLRSNFLKNFKAISLILITLGFFNFLIFQREVLFFLKKLNYLSTLLFVLFFILEIAIIYFSRKKLQRPVGFISRFPNQFFLRMDYRYLISKWSEIFFQQILIIALVYIIYFSSTLNIYLVFLIIFGLSHIPVIYFTNWRWGIYFTVMASISAFIFPVLILKFDYGFIYSFIIHSAFYSLSGLFLWIKENLFKK